jgi:hypothetical protein
MVPEIWRGKLNCLEDLTQSVMEAIYLFDRAFTCLGAIDLFAIDERT